VPPLRKGGKRTAKQDPEERAACVRLTFHQPGEASKPELGEIRGSAIGQSQVENGVQLGGGATGAGGNSRRVSDAGGVEKHEDPIRGLGEITENLTSEADFEEIISIMEAQDPVEVTANSGALSRLDNVATQPGEAWSDLKLGTTVLARRFREGSFRIARTGGICCALG